MIRCPRCKTPISKKWLFNSHNYNEYNCPKCGIVLKWNKLRVFARFIGFCFMSYIIVTAKDNWQIKNIVLRFLLTILVAFCVSYLPLIIFPFIKNSIYIKKVDEGTKKPQGRF